MCAQGLDRDGCDAAAFSLRHPNQYDMTFVADTAELALKWAKIKWE